MLAFFGHSPHWPRSTHTAFVVANGCFSFFWNPICPGACPGLPGGGVFLFTKEYHPPLNHAPVQFGRYCPAQRFQAQSRNPATLWVEAEGESSSGYQIVGPATPSLEFKQWMLPSDVSFATHIQAGFGAPASVDYVGVNQLVISLIGRQKIYNPPK